MTDSLPDRVSDSDAPTPRPNREAMLAQARTVSAEQGGGSGSSRKTFRWSRWIHVYTSMIAFVIILFFGVTGVTLNHPDWTFGDDTDTAMVTGTLGVDATNSDGSVNYLGVSEWIRTNEGVGGSVSSFDSTANQASIGYRNPGYEADLIFDTETGEYTLTTVQSGWVGVMNDLHKGRNADTSWRWLIDISGIFLVAVSLTGLVMQFYLRKRRTAAYVTAAVGGVIVIVLGWIALH